MTQNLQDRAPKRLLKVDRQFSVFFETRSQARAVDKIMLEPRCGFISPECTTLLNSVMGAISGHASRGLVTWRFDTLAA